ncbi:MAG: hypothetical protein HQ453_10665 [Actinobacteria bacterium]|nr:hypothetical protein [Actinomycetota bacterium]
MFKVADEANFVIQRFELAERLETLAVSLPDPSQQAEQRKIALELINELGPLRLTIVGKILGLMDKTAREWAREGALRIEIHDPRMLIDPLSVHTVFHLVKELRAASQTRGLLASVSRRLANAALLESTDLQGSLGHMRHGQGEIARLRPSA